MGRHRSRAGAQSQRHAAGGSAGRSGQQRDRRGPGIRRSPQFFRLLLRVHVDDRSVFCHLASAHDTVRELLLPALQAHRRGRQDEAGEERVADVGERPLRLLLRARHEDLVLLHVLHDRDVLGDRRQVPDTQLLDGVLRICRVRLPEPGDLLLGLPGLLHPLPPAVLPPAAPQQDGRPYGLDLRCHGRGLLLRGVLPLRRGGPRGPGRRARHRAEDVRLRVERAPRSPPFRRQLAASSPPSPPPPPHWGRRPPPASRRGRPRRSTPWRGPRP
mmetsp:Transcript_35959/g.101015  ORF Transcript_35959/g.101015 Transcript_35959/m.101015 type:complete len:272 (+) Transcript_35959:420-1235(+)